MKPTAFVTLFFLICSLDFRAVSGGKKTTTRSPNVCSKGITVTFPSYISKTNGVSNTDPLFSKKCKNVLNTFGLWLLCNSGPKYQCSIPSTPPTSITTTTTAATATSTTTTAATATSTTSTTQSGLDCDAFGGSNICGQTNNISYPIFVSSFPNVSISDPLFLIKCVKVFNSFSLGTLCITGPKYKCKTSTTPTTPTPPTVCSYNGTTYPVGSQIENTTNSPLCYILNCQSNGSWAPAPTTGACVPPFQNYPLYGCLMIVANASIDFCTARLECQKAGGDLWTSAYLDTMEDFANISSTLFPQSNMCCSWLGIYGKGANLYWLNGTVATDKYLPMGGYQVNNYTGFCVNGFIGRNSYIWDILPCNNPSKYICERLP